MRYYSLILILASSFALAQTTAPTPAPDAKAAAPAQSSAQNSAQGPAAAPSKAAKDSKEVKEVAPDAAVITVQGVCGGKPGTGSDCKTVITKKQFDQMADALYGARVQNGEIPATAKRNLAQSWAKVIVLSAQGEKDGVTDQPRTQMLAKFGTMQATAQEEMRVIETKATPSEAEVQKYYDDNKNSKYWEAEVERIVIPAHGTGEHAPDDAAMKAMTDDIVTRAKAGQPFEQLQMEVSEKTGISKQIQSKMTVRPGMLQPDAEKRLRDAKPGEVGTTGDAAMGTQVYKLIKMTDVPFDKVKETIKRQLMQERLQKDFEAVIVAHPATLNDDFFGAETQQPGPGVMSTR
jgi:hypothetical protein